MKKRLSILGVAAMMIFIAAEAGAVKLPTFLPDFYMPAFQMHGKPLRFAGRASEEAIDQWRYASEDRALALMLEQIPCDRASRKGILNSILDFLNREIRKNGGEFKDIADREIHAVITDREIQRTVLVFELAAAVHIWSFFQQPGAGDLPFDLFETIRAMADRQRYIEARAAGNVAMGHWAPQIHAHARRLLASGQTGQALGVLGQLLIASPANYEAHADVMDHAGDREAGARSADIIFRHAEDPELIQRAARFLDRPLGQTNTVPFLEKGEKGCQLILIPLDPCQLILLEESARIYEQITGIPVKIRRLKENWELSAPDRIPLQRKIQGILVEKEKVPIDFTGWTKADYIRKLRRIADQEDALTRYRLEQMIRTVDTSSGQYSVDSRLDWFCRVLKTYRPRDPKTMYVGVTRANIYSGDTNWIFSYGYTAGPTRASILSYHMMRAAALSDPLRSRPRLAERVAKELVPASLKQLGIPRSTDPGCPYSYADGVARLDRKTLTLSDPVKAALSRL